MQQPWINGCSPSCAIAGPPKTLKVYLGGQHQRRINAETLQLIFQLLFEPLQAVAREGVNIDCANGTVHRGFPVLSAWIADHMENVAPHGVKSNSSPKCKLLPWVLGNDAKYSARDYTEYEYCKRENGLQSSGSDLDDADGDDVTFDTLKINMGPGVFHRLYQVSAPDLHVPDLLHTIYLGLFKHMIDWIQVFLRQDGRLQAFDDAWKT